MNTPAHVIANLVLQTAEDRREWTVPVVWGALIPDLPMLFFFLWERLVLGTPDAVVWGERYFAAHWQDFFDVFNSIPLALLGLAAAWRWGTPAGCALFVSMLLHHALDLPLHNDDAHRHFWPLSDYRFASPVSYWDPRFFGAWAALAETVLVAVGAFVLLGRGFRGFARVALVAAPLLYAAVWLGIYGFGHYPS